MNKSLRKVAISKMSNIKTALRRKMAKKPKDNMADLEQAKQKTQDLAHKYNKLKVHIGCGPRVLKGWLNFDLAFEPYANYLQYYTDTYYPAEIRGDKNDFIALDIARYGIPLPDNSVDVVFHEDFLEHLYQRQQIGFLAEIWRVLKPGAIHRINTPDIVSSMRRQSDFQKGLLGIYADEWEKHGHINVLGKESLREMALMVGYKEIVFGSRDQSRSSYIPLEYRPDPNDRPEEGNLFADLIK